MTSTAVKFTSLCVLLLLGGMVQSRNNANAMGLNGCGGNAVSLIQKTGRYKSATAQVDTTFITPARKSLTPHKTSTDLLRGEKVKPRHGVGVKYSRALQLRKSDGISSNLSLVSIENVIDYRRSHTTRFSFQVNQFVEYARYERTGYGGRLTGFKPERRVNLTIGLPLMFHYQTGTYQGIIFGLGGGPVVTIGDEARLEPRLMGNLGYAFCVAGDHQLRAMLTLQNFPVIKYYPYKRAQNLTLGLNIVFIY